MPTFSSVSGMAIYFMRVNYGIEHIINHASSIVAYCIGTMLNKCMYIYEKNRLSML